MFPFIGKGQSTSLGWWQIINAEIVLNNQWSINVEGHLRSQRFIKALNFYEIGSNLNYKPYKDVSMSCGVNQIETFSNEGNFAKPITGKELRVWEQLAFINNIGKIRIEHRYRVEQRWRSDGYRNRFRLRLNSWIPINKPTMEKGTFYANLYDEVFFTDKWPNFEMNWVFGGLGYQFSSSAKFQAGWFKQYNHASHPITKINLLQTSLFIRLKPS